MGVSSDAMLLYGINMGEPREAALKLGYEEPDEMHESEDPYVEFIEEKLPKCLELTLAGHPEGCPTWFISGKCITANRGYEKHLSELPKVSKQAKAALKKLEKLLDLEAVYWLASYSDF